MEGSCYYCCSALDTCGAAAVIDREWMRDENGERRLPTLLLEDFDEEEERRTDGVMRRRNGWADGRTDGGMDGERGRGTVRERLEWRCKHDQSAPNQFHRHFLFTFSAPLKRIGWLPLICHAALKTHKHEHTHKQTGAQSQCSTQERPKVQRHTNI